MWITVSKCRNYEASVKFRTEQALFFDNEKFILFGNDAPDCMNCSIHYESNGGVPCRIAYNPEIYKGGKYKNRPELAARRVCKKVNRDRRRKKYLYDYARRQAISRWCRQYIATHGRREAADD